MEHLDVQIDFCWLTIDICKNYLKLGLQKSVHHKPVWTHLHLQVVLILSFWSDVIIINQNYARNKMGNEQEISLGTALLPLYNRCTVSEIMILFHADDIVKLPFG